MATAQKVEVVLGEPTPKKHSVQFRCREANAATTTLYVDNAALAALGNPDKIRVTIEAA